MKSHRARWKAWKWQTWSLNVADKHGSNKWNSLRTTVCLRCAFYVLWDPNGFMFSWNDVYHSCGYALRLLHFFECDTCVLYRKCELHFDSMLTDQKKESHGGRIEWGQFVFWIYIFFLLLFWKWSSINGHRMVEWIPYRVGGRKHWMCHIRLMNYFPFHPFVCVAIEWVRTTLINYTYTPGEYTKWCWTETCAIAVIGMTPFKLEWRVIIPLPTHETQSSHTRTARASST